MSPLIFALSIEPLANWIWSHKDISGITIGHKEHKTSLFADDLVVYITQPQTSLRHLHNVLHDFYKVLRFKTNCDKSDIFPIIMKQADIKHLQSCSPFPWIHQKWTHLETDIPLNLHQLYTANYCKVAKAIKHQLSTMKSQFIPGWIRYIYSKRLFYLSFYFYSTCYPCPFQRQICRFSKESLTISFGVINFIGFLSEP